MTSVVVVAVKSAFSRLRNLYTKIEPVFVENGFTPPSYWLVTCRNGSKNRSSSTAIRFHDCDLPGTVAIGK
jgi:hypothetical protein